MAKLSEVKTIKANTDINAFTLGKMLSFCGQFIDGQAASMLLPEDGEWKVDLCLGNCNHLWSLVCVLQRCK